MERMRYVPPEALAEPQTKRKTEEPAKRSKPEIDLEQVFYGDYPEPLDPQEHPVAPEQLQAIEEL